MNAHAQIRMTFDEFMRWTENQERKFELIEGVPRMFGSVNAGHSMLGMRLRAMISTRGDDAKWIVPGCSFPVRTCPDQVRFADVLVVPSDASPSAGHVENPVIVIEVLSKSTMHADFGEKRIEYLALPSLHAYLIFAQDEAHVWLWRRREDGAFASEPEQVDGLDAAVTLDQIGVTLALSEVYRGLVNG